MGTFLLVHGGSHGAWCWDLVRTELERRGHTASALDLPGHGSDLTDRRLVRRESYINAVNAYIFDSALNNITLIGHSLAGTVLPAIWKANSYRVKEVIFIAALVLKKGEAPIDLILESRRHTYVEKAERSPDFSFHFDKETAHSLFFDGMSPTEVDTFYHKMTPQPFNVYLEQSESDPDFRDTPVRYVLCRSDRALPHDLCLSCAAKLGVVPEYIDAGHDVMLSHPHQITDLIVSGSDTAKPVGILQQ